MANFSAKYVADLLFHKHWFFSECGVETKNEFTKAELELILLYVKHPEGEENYYLKEVEKALANGEYKQCT